LVLIGEAASRLPADFRLLHPEAAWGKAAGLRNRIVHKYWDLDWDVLWSTIQVDVPAIRDVAATILNADYSKEE